MNRQFLCNLFLFVALFFATTSFTLPKPKLTEAEKIDQLINYVRSLEGAVFIRNGTEYSAAKAAAHLELKRENAGNKIKTAEDFIKYLATKSSFSGKPYLIKMANGKTYTSAAVLTKELQKIENKEVK